MVQWLNVLAVDKAAIKARVQTPPQWVEIEIYQQKDCVWACQWYEVWKWSKYLKKVYPILKWKKKQPRIEPRALM